MKLQLRQHGNPTNEALLSAQPVSMCHFKIAADTLIFTQNRREMGDLFSFTLIWLLYQLPTFFFNVKTTRPYILIAASTWFIRSWMLTWHWQSTEAFFNAFLPIICFHIAMKLHWKYFFFALGKTSHIEFDYDLYIYGGKLIFNASNFLCLIILSKMSKCIIMELPETWKMSHFLAKLF